MDSLSTQVDSLLDVTIALGEAAETEGWSPSTADHTLGVVGVLAPQEDQDGTGRFRAWRDARVHQWPAPPRAPRNRPGPTSSAKESR